MKILWVVILLWLVSFISLSEDTQTNSKVYISTDFQIWSFDMDDLSYDLVLSVDESSSMISRFMLTQDNSKLYFIEYTDTLSTLNSYTIDTGTVEQIFEHPNLTLMTPSSGDRLFLGLIDREQPEKSSTCLLSVLSEDCRIVDISINFDSFYWLGNDEFVTFSYDTAKFYRLPMADTDKIELERVVHLDNLKYSTTTMSHEQIVFAAFNGEDQLMYSLNPSTYEISQLSTIVLPDINASINKIELSPDGHLLAYKIQQIVFVVNLLTGDSIAQFEDVLNFRWNSNSILIGISAGNRAKTYDLLVIDLQNNAISESILVPTETNSVLFPQ